MRALFVPLMSEYFHQFADGKKSTEWRVYGPRWNENTCTIGRPIILSKGYSGVRLTGRIKSFRIVRHDRAPQSVRDLFPHASHFAAIGINVYEGVKP